MENAQLHKKAKKSSFKQAIVFSPYLIAPLHPFLPPSPPTPKQMLIPNADEFGRMEGKALSYPAGGSVSWFFSEVQPGKFMEN